MEVHFNARGPSRFQLEGGRYGKDSRMKLSSITKFLGSDRASAVPKTIRLANRHPIVNDFQGGRGDKPGGGN